MRRSAAILPVLGIVLAAAAARAAAPVATASSGERGDLPASHAVDADPGTRWSSAFTDSEWLRVDHGAVRDVAGLRIRWETAYGRDYDVLTSVDGAAWERAAAVRDGDGGVDLVLFRPRPARFVEIRGIRRGTGWGYSIWEMDLVPPAEAPAAEATSERAGGAAAAAIDGETGTAWASAGAGREVLTLRFPAPFDVGGLEIRWGGAPAAAYRVEGSVDGVAWETLAEVGAGDGGTDLVFFPGAARRAVRIACVRPAAGADRYEIAEVSLKAGGEAWSPVRHYEALVTQYPDGALPRWLARAQEFWTIVGVPNDAEEALLSEDGTVEPFYNGPTIMPFLVVDGAVVSARTAGAAPTQALVDGTLPLPSVRWPARGAVPALSVEAVGIGAPGASVALVRYRVENPAPTPREVRLALAVRPVTLNPTWQHGGFHAVREGRFEVEGRVLRLDGRPLLVAHEAPAAAFFATRADGDVHPRLAAARGVDRSAADSDGLVSAALCWDLALPGGGSSSILVAYFQHPVEAPLLPLFDAAGPDAVFDRLVEEEAAAWRAWTGEWSIRAPVEGLEEVVRSNLAYMILNRDHEAPQPGPRNYAKAWMRDGAISSITFLRFGMDEPVRRYLDWFTPLVSADGYVPPIVKSDESTEPEWARGWREYDAFGEYVYAVRAYRDFTGDDEAARRWFPTVLRALAHQERLIESRRADTYAGTEYFGILPESNSHEGYFPAVHSYWDDFFAVRGIEDGADLAAALGADADAARLRADADRFRRDFHASMRAVIARDGLAFIPGCAEKGDFDPTSTSIALDHCGEAPPLLADPVLGPRLRAGFDRYFADVRARWTGGAWGSFTPYEVRNIEALVRLGEREKAAALLAFFLGEPIRPRAWNHMAEVVHPDPRTPSYIGDMPHTWVGADFANAVRSFFLFEEGDVLILAGGVPAAWLEDEGVGVEEMRTPWGGVSFDFRRDGDALVFEAEGDAAPPGGFVLRPPGLPEARFESLPAEIRIEIP